METTSVQQGPQPPCGTSAATSGERALAPAAEVEGVDRKRNQQRGRPPNSASGVGSFPDLLRFQFPTRDIPVGSPSAEIRRVRELQGEDIVHPIAASL